MSEPLDPVDDMIAALRSAMAALDLTLWSASGAHVFNSETALHDFARSLLARKVLAPSMAPTSLRMRLGPFPNELDAARSIHKRQEVATPDDHSDVMCAQCYIFDEGWPCTVARLIAVLDAQIEDEAP